MNPWGSPTDPEVKEPSNGNVSASEHSADAFDMAKLIEGTNDVGATSSTETKDAAVARAKEHKWAPKQAYDYDQLAEAPGATENLTQVPWLSDAQKYEWQEEFGDVGPRNEALEADLFGADTIVRPGDLINTMNEYAITQEGPARIFPVRQFEDAGLHPIMLDNIKLMRYETPTPIQAYCMPAIFKGHDILACAQTGSGKTAAYLVPIVSKLMGKAKKLCAARPHPLNYNPETDRVVAQPLVLVVCPSRELATQIFDEARRCCYRSMLRPCVIYGGAPSGLQQYELNKGCDVLIATPGRLMDYMEKPNVLSLARVKYTVIDEADEMLQSDWEDDMKKIMSGGDMNQDADHRYLMFSATFPKEIRQLAGEYLDPYHVRIRVGRAGSTHDYITQRFVYVDPSEKRKATYDLLFSMPCCRTIIFVNNVGEVDALDDYLYNLELPCTSMHSKRTQREREDAIRAFRTGRCPILIATGVSARGLDIKNVHHIINYDLPKFSYGGGEEYIHRIGRTARIGNKGYATSFVTDKDLDDEDMCKHLVKLLLESKQGVPDFLQQFMPEGGIVIWDDEDDEEGEEQGGSGEATHVGAQLGGFGSSTGVTNAPSAPVAQTGWGSSTGVTDAPTATGAQTGWGSSANVATAPSAPVAQTGWGSSTGVTDAPTATGAQTGWGSSTGVTDAPTATGAQTGWGSSANVATAPSNPITQIGWGSSAVVTNTIPAPNQSSPHAPNAGKARIAPLAGASSNARPGGPGKSALTALFQAANAGNGGLGASKHAATSSISVGGAPPSGPDRKGKAPADKDDLLE